MPDDICFLCDKKIEGENISFTLHEGFILFQRDKPGTPHREIAHNCKRPEYYEKRSQSQRASKLDRALRKAIMNPTTAARAELDDQIYDALMAVAKRGNTMDSLRAAERLVALFVGSEPPPEVEPERTQRRDIAVVVRENPTLLASPRAEVRISDDNGDDGTRQAQDAIQQSFEAQQELADLQQPNSKGNGKAQQQDDVEDYEAVEDRRRQEYWELEVEAWENSSAAKRRGIFG